ncbi:hypothetical protein H9P43_004503 [Blastocladiella emersonii ATCC 22665]|nr:hypothetical protein H9P43_004503 [Blastocladiella emersonii ATCC 22665]
MGRKRAQRRRRSTLVPSSAGGDDDPASAAFSSAYPPPTHAPWTVTHWDAELLASSPPPSLSSTPTPPAASRSAATTPRRSHTPDGRRPAHLRAPDRSRAASVQSVRDRARSDRERAQRLAQPLEDYLQYLDELRAAASRVGGTGYMHDHRSIPENVLDLAASLIHSCCEAVANAAAHAAKGRGGNHLHHATHAGAAAGAKRRPDDPARSIAFMRRTLAAADVSTSSFLLAIYYIDQMRKRQEALAPPPTPSSAAAPATPLALAANPAPTLRRSNSRSRSLSRSRPGSPAPSATGFGSNGNLFASPSSAPTSAASSPTRSLFSIPSMAVSAATSAVSAAVSSAADPLDSLATAAVTAVVRAAMQQRTPASSPYLSPLTPPLPLHLDAVVTPAYAPPVPPLPAAPSTLPRLLITTTAATSVPRGPTTPTNSTSPYAHPPAPPPPTPLADLISPTSPESGAAWTPASLFIAALMVADKMLFDSIYRNADWAVLTPFSLRDINRAERAFLAAAGWQLRVPDASELERFVLQLQTRVVRARWARGMGLTYFDLGVIWRAAGGPSVAAKQVVVAGTRHVAAGLVGLLGMIFGWLALVMARDGVLDLR